MIMLDHQKFSIIISLMLMLVACNQPESAKVNEARLTAQELTKFQNSAELENREEVFLFGFDLRISPQEDARQYLPFLNYLKRSTGLNFELRFTSKDNDIVSDLGSDKIQFAAIGAVSFIHARRNHGVVALGMGVNTQGKSTYRSHIVVLPDSPLKKIEDLRGKRLAFGSMTSTQGYLIPRIMLQKNGLRLEDLATYSYTGSHQNCADAVLAKRTDACGMQDTLAEWLAEKGQVRILHRSEEYPSSGIVANASVPDAIVAKVRKALFEFDPTGRDEIGLYAWQRTEMPLGFVEPHLKAYRPLETWMQHFKKD